MAQSKNMRMAKKLLKKINEKTGFFRTMSVDSLKKYREEVERLYTLLGDKPTKKNHEEFLVDAVAFAREVTYRTTGKFHFDVQVLGGLMMHQGNVVEMLTGQGKTLTSILPIYLNTFDGKKVHVVTVNDYLAQRDSEEMEETFNFLGRTVGRIWPNMPEERRKLAYKADIVYGINSEFGFDYLKDNMVLNKENRVQQGLHTVLIDEVDSVLIDEAKTPLIITHPSFSNPNLYLLADAVVKHKHFVKGPDVVDMSRIERLDFEEEEALINEVCHYRINPKDKSVFLTDRGVKRVEKFFKLDKTGEKLADRRNAILYHHIIQAIKANATMEKDVNYIVKDDEIIIVDEFTGRKMEGRRFSDGLHQALEAKEGLSIKGENDTTASITLQNYFRMYEKITGMSGTVETEKKEFSHVYRTLVEVVPPNKSVIRNDEETVVFATEKEKFEAIIERAVAEQGSGRPVLIGTSSIEKSLMLYKEFKDRGFFPQVLNAKEVERESYIIAQAGRSGQITIATNMAGRGTDIFLGGNPDYIAREELIRKGYPADDVLHASSVVYSELDRSDYHQNFIELLRQYEVILKQKTEICRIDREAVLRAGGLFVIGTELSSSRRVDNQLRGRSGRQGEPGGSKFFVSLEDDLFRSVQPDLIEALKDLIANGKSSTSLLKHVLGFQKNVERQSYEQRKNLLEFDEVDNMQRSLVYEFRNQVLDGVANKDLIKDYYLSGLYQFAENKWEEILKKADKDNLFHSCQEQTKTLLMELDSSRYRTYVSKCLVIKKLEKLKKLSVDSIYEGLLEKLKEYDDSIQEQLQKLVLQSIDQNWKDYLVALQNTKDSVNMTYLSQVKPIERYKEESSKNFAIFKECFGLTLAEKIVRVISAKIKLERTMF